MAPKGRKGGKSRGGKFGVAQKVKKSRILNKIKKRQEGRFLVGHGEASKGGGYNA